MILSETEAVLTLLGKRLLSSRKLLDSSKLEPKLESEQSKKYSVTFAWVIQALGGLTDKGVLGCCNGHLGYKGLGYAGVCWHGVPTSYLGSLNTLRKRRPEAGMTVISARLSCSTLVMTQYFVPNYCYQSYYDHAQVCQHCPLDHPNPWSPLKYQPEHLFQSQCLLLHLFVQLCCLWVTGEVFFVLSCLVALQQLTRLHGH